MITPEEIVKRAERKYRDVLRAWLTDEEIFPIEFPVGKLSNKLPERRQQIELLRDKSKEITRQGYDIRWRTVNKRHLGKQTTPKRIIIPDMENYLALLHKRTEFKQFVSDVERLRQHFPDLEQWIIAYPHEIIAYQGEWPDLITVCDYFVKHPRPNMYIRELPITVHTKFIETHTRILRDLLDVLLPENAIAHEETDFIKRFGLKDKPILVRMRFLEEQFEWEYGVRIDDLMLPVDQAAHLLRDHLRPKRIVIVENLMNFLTLPSLPNTIALFGGGFGVHVLRYLDWLHDCNVIYWGDIDAHGFQILSDLRGLFPHTVSIMMDCQTFDAYQDYMVEGKAIRAEQFEHLTADEQALAEVVVQENARLEQEHISHTDVINAFKRLMRGRA